MKLPLNFLVLSAPCSSLLFHSHGTRRTRLFYKPSDDENAWNVLANTEKWISETLDKSNKAANEAKKLHFAEEKEPANNPYVRKEVSYVCEPGGEICGVVGGIFRRVKEAREMGERHGKESCGKTSTMRSTNVVVIPNCKDLSEFHDFDDLVQAINLARRSARDFVTKRNDNSDDMSWLVSINCAHLHPQYGVPTSEETLASMKKEEQSGEIDLHLQDYKKRRDEARRSPYPSVIVEVQSSPPPDFGAATVVGDAGSVDRPNMNVDRDEGVTIDDVKRLEALFGMSAASKKSDDLFYDALGEAFGKKQIAAQTPLSMAENWVLINDPAFDGRSSTFTSSSTSHVDAAYEYVFNTLAMISMDGPKLGQKSYVVLPNFLPTSATSFDRFGGQVSNIIRVMPSMADKVLISTFHPEHVETATRSPVPIFVVTWK